MRGHAVALAAVIALAAGLAVRTAPPAAAQAPTASAPTATATPTGQPGRPQPTDAQALAVERELLCPICTNERLDVCQTAICADMKRVIRERLAAGSTPDEIILFFESRYGPKVRAALPREGFNLVLFGWVGGALALSAAAAAYALYTLRRDSRRRAAASAVASPTEGDAWVDRLLDTADDARDAR